eukprot:3731721-Pleurochrysis_carterae.AAC.2
MLCTYNELHESIFKDRQRSRHVYWRYSKPSITSWDTSEPKTESSHGNGGLNRQCDDRSRGTATMFRRIIHRRTGSPARKFSISVSPSASCRAAVSSALGTFEALLLLRAAVLLQRRAA